MEAPKEGHGHVFPALLVARCGGPGVCADCKKEQQQAGQLRAAADKSVCSYCGELGPKTDMGEHVLACKKRPEHAMGLCIIGLTNRLNEACKMLLGEVPFSALGQSKWVENTRAVTDKLPAVNLEQVYAAMIKDGCGLSRHQEDFIRSELRWEKIRP